MRIIPAGLALALLALLAPCAFAQQEPIKIGVCGALSGDLASLGRSVRDGVVLATEEINASGGVLSRKIELVVEDNQSKPEQAKTVFEKLIKRDHVAAILGDVTSQCSLAAAPVAQDAKVPMLSPTATNEKVTQEGDYVFRACFIDPFQGSAMAKFAITELKATKIALLYNTKDAYSVGLHDAFIAYARSHGAEILADLSYSSGDVDFKGQITKIRQAKPEVIYAPGYYTEIGLICRQARGLGITQPILGSDGWDSQKTAEIGGTAVNGCYFTNHYSEEDPRPEVQAFITAYKARYGRIPDALAILGYDAGKLMADAIKRGGSTDGAAIRAALAATKDFPAASGAITMDGNRNVQKPIVVIKIENQKFHFAKAVDMSK